VKSASKNSIGVKMPFIFDTVRKHHFYFSQWEKAIGLTKTEFIHPVV